MSGKNWTAGPWKSTGSLVYFANNAGGLCVDGTPNPNENANLIAAAPDLYEALECQNAMSLPADEGVKVLEAHGWSYADRLYLPASEFVRKMTEAAMRQARGEK